MRATAWQRGPRSGPRPLVGGFLLIALGILFLLGNLVMPAGSLLFVGLGLAFVAARIVTGSYGHAVPAGVLLGFGTFVLLRQAGWLSSEESTWLFVLLGLGFIAVYVLGWRASAIWPLFPATALIGLGLTTLGWDSVLPIDSLSSLAAFASLWPIVLALAGLWLLVRDRLAPPARRLLLLASSGLLALLVVVGVAGALAVAASAIDRNVGRNLGFSLNGRGPNDVTVNGGSLSETVTLEAPIGTGGTFRLLSSNGRTTIRGGTGSSIRVVATSRYWASGRAPQVRLTPEESGVKLDAVQSERGLLGRSGRVDYVVEIPANVNVEAQIGSGDVELASLAGALRIQVGSGDASLTNVSGPVEIHTWFGDVILANVSGELRVVTGSGSLRGAGLTNARELHTGSGDIVVSGTFKEDGRIQTGSGNVTVRFAPASSARLDVATASGELKIPAGALEERAGDRHRVTGRLGAGAGSLIIQTQSGDVTLAAEAPVYRP
ncbi:MAG: DUF4097 family beta strand repeat protein [Chloroflexi bacterium]|nr:DUF4097 family beta strand repeat protein [Chloroflexota bacterium]